MCIGNCPSGEDVPRRGSQQTPNLVWSMEHEVARWLVECPQEESFLDKEAILTGIREASHRDSLRFLTAGLTGIRPMDTERHVGVCSSQTNGCDARFPAQKALPGRLSLPAGVPRACQMLKPTV